MGAVISLLLVTLEAGCLIVARRISLLSSEFAGLAATDGMLARPIEPGSRWCAAVRRTRRTLLTERKLLVHVVARPHTFTGKWYAADNANIFSCSMVAWVTSPTGRPSCHMDDVFCGSLS